MANIFGRIYGKAYRMIKGNHAWAIKNGMKVGTGCVFSPTTEFGSEPYLIKCGDRVKTSLEVLFLTHDGGTWAFKGNDKYKGIVKYGPIVIGDDTFIGARAIIMPGVHIGKNCVIGTGSVVTKDVPDNCIYAGVPSKFICTTEEYAEKSLKNMPEGFDFQAYNENKTEYLKKLFHDDIF